MTADDTDQPQLVITARTAFISGAALSALLVALGVFGPLITMFGLSLAVWEADLGKVIAVLGVLVAAMLAAALTSRFRFHQEWAAIAFGWLALGTACYYIYAVLKARSDIPTGSNDDPFAGLAQAFAPSLGWGVILVGVASLTLIAASALAIQQQRALLVAVIGVVASIAIGIGTGAANGHTDLASEKSTASSQNHSAAPYSVTEEPPSLQNTAAATTTAEPVPDDVPSVVAPVPGSNDNVYNVGPFKVEMVHGITASPSQSTASEIRVTNTSNDFTGYGKPTVTYFQGDDVLGSNTATTSRLSPGQSDTVWVDVDSYKPVAGQWVDAQLIDFWWGTQIGHPGSTAQLQHAPFESVTAPPVVTTPPTPQRTHCNSGATRRENEAGDYSICVDGVWQYMHPTYDPDSGDGYGPNQPLPPLCVRFPDQYSCPN
jgi:hypothetical protein